MGGMYRRIRIPLLLVMVVVACGCRQTLFPMNKQRNQFEAYNTMRYGPPILEQPDPFGLPEPALRARLERNHE
jgi:hypothetical protein